MDKDIFLFALDCSLLKMILYDCMNKLSYQKQDGIVLDKGFSGMSTLGTYLTKHLQSIVQANYLQRLYQNQSSYLFQIS